MIDKIEQGLIDSAIRVIKSGEGCLFIIKLKEVDCDPLVRNDLAEPFSIFEDFYQKRLDILAKIDGACIINEKGELIAYGMKINKTKTFNGYGTRHSAAYSTSLKGNISILGSQESKKVRIFKSGKLIMQIDALEKGVEKNTGRAVGILESVGVGALSTIGAGLIFPVGIALIPGIVLFGSSHYLISSLMKKGLKN